MLFDIVQSLTLQQPISKLVQLHFYQDINHIPPSRLASGGIAPEPVIKHFHDAFLGRVVGVLLQNFFRYPHSLTKLMPLGSHLRAEVDQQAIKIYWSIC